MGHNFVFLFYSDHTKKWHLVFRADRYVMLQSAKAPENHPRPAAYAHESKPAWKISHRYCKESLAAESSDPSVKLAEIAIVLGRQVYIHTRQNVVNVCAGDVSGCPCQRYAMAFIR